LYQATGRPAYRLVFEFWLKIFGVAFGMGVVSDIVMAFQFGTNWEVFARMVGPRPSRLRTDRTRAGRANARTEECRRNSPQGKMP
jgi:cytochrome d ubiquinol oxidase subunit I